jgi:DNA-binding response OmpR family regulator
VNEETTPVSAERRPRILIVDDEEDIRTVLQARLETAGIEVRTAATGMEALERIRSDPPDLIVLDLMLPGIDGFGVCAMVKRDQRFSRIPVILLTARSQPQDRLTGTSLGADAYLTKPFRADELLAEIRKHLDGQTETAPECSAKTGTVPDCGASSAGDRPPAEHERVPATEATS